jgi:hypothetical protein
MNRSCHVFSLASKTGPSPKSITPQGVPFKSYLLRSATRLCFAMCFVVRFMLKEKVFSIVVVINLSVCSTSRYSPSSRPYAPNSRSRLSYCPYPLITSPPTPNQLRIREYSGIKRQWQDASSVACAHRAAASHSPTRRRRHRGIRSVSLCMSLCMSGRMTANHNTQRDHIWVIKIAAVCVGFSS